MPGMHGTRCDLLKFDSRDISQSVRQDPGIKPPADQHLIQPRELFASDGRLHIRHPVVESDRCVAVLAGFTMAAHCPHCFAILGVISAYHSPFTDKHVLGRIEGVGDKIIESANFSLLPGCAMRLGGIPYDNQSVTICKLFHSVNVDRIAEQMHRRDGAGALR